MKKHQNKLVNREVSVEDLQKIEKTRKNISRVDLFHHEEEKNIKKIALGRKNLTKEEMDDLSNELIAMHGLENGYFVSRIGYHKHASTLSKIREKIITENDCKTITELMIVDRIVASYWRIIRYETIFNRFVEDEEGQFNFSQLTVNALKEVNKGLEISHRQHSNNLILLKELKQPNLKVTVKTGNAYFAENQQINNNNKGNDALKDNMGNH